MARPQLTPLLILLALAANACDARRDDAGESSVTVKLPPSRRPAAPAFTFNSQEKPPPGSDRD